MLGSLRISLFSSAVYGNGPEHSPRSLVDDRSKLASAGAEVHLFVVLATNLPPSMWESQETFFYFFFFFSLN